MRVGEKATLRAACERPTGGIEMGQCEVATPIAARITLGPWRGGSGCGALRAILNTVVMSVDSMCSPCYDF